MGYCFMRIEKIHTSADFTRKYEHNYRLEPVPNADILAISNNKELIELNGKSYLDAFHEKIEKSDYYNGPVKRKYKSNSVKAIEIVTTFSREDGDKIDIEKWQEDNVKWLRETFNRRPDKYGDNVVSVVYHGDEGGNVHCHALIIPIDENGVLNAKSYTNGRAEMRKLQSSYAKAMEPHNLKRGLEGSMAKHKDIKKFYASMNQELIIEAPVIKRGETFEAYRERVTEIMRMQNARNYSQKLKMERKIDEVKTINRQTLTNTRKEMHDVERERNQYKKEISKLEEEHGPMEIIKGKLHTVELLDNGLQNYPDREFAGGVRNGMQKLIDYQKKKEKEKKREEKLKKGYLKDKENSKQKGGERKHE